MHLAATSGTFAIVEGCAFVYSIRNDARNFDWFDVNWGLVHFDPNFEVYFPLSLAQE